MRRACAVLPCSAWYLYVHLGGRTRRLVPAEEARGYRSVAPPSVRPPPAAVQRGATTPAVSSGGCHSERPRALTLGHERSACQVAENRADCFAASIVTPGGTVIYLRVWPRTSCYATPMISEGQWLEAARAQNRSLAWLWDKIAEIDAQRDGVSAGSAGMVRYRDREGDPLTLGQWAMLTEGNAYRWVGSTTLEPSGIWVATIWRGMVDAFNTDTGVLFETTVFSRRQPDGREALEREQYLTEAAAIAGHDRFVRKWTDWQRRQKQVNAQRPPPPG